MTTQMETKVLLKDLGRFAQVRGEMGKNLANMANILETAESIGQENSGKLELDGDIEDLKRTSKNLIEGVFRLLVLGDMKRGKSTFLNALIGEKLLPSDVNPCTAILTLLRYGNEKKVTVYFNDGKSPETVDFKSFKTNYTIDPAEAKKLEKEQKQAFPNIDYAVVEYPLSLLEKGVEIVDSPGLNDTEARNELSLGYINNCHAILFVLRASQPCTLAERRYLENYLKDRGLTVFFLINAWDQVKDSLIDPDDPEELEEAEEKLHRVFKANLAEYCMIDGVDIYHDRVFPISSLPALRQQLKDPNSPLENTGFPEFMGALNTFLTKEKAIGQLRQGKILGKQIYNNVREAVSSRIPLLQQDIQELKERIASVAPEFEELTQIRDDFNEEIRKVRDDKAKKIADSFRNYVLNLGNTFEVDFLQYQPDLKFLDFLNQSKREGFEKELQQAFERYINDKLSEWSLGAEKEMDMAFAQLSLSARSYGDSYNKVTNKITQKLTGQKIPSFMSGGNEEDTPSWAKWAAGIFSMAQGNLAGLAMAGAGFDWKNIILNFITVLGVGTIMTALTGIVLGPLRLALLGLGVGIMQADQARKELVKATKKELLKHLPSVAQEQWQPVYDAIKECFDTYEKEVMARINEDIRSRKAQLDNLVAQKESQEINNNAELTRLEDLTTAIKSELDQVESQYQEFFMAVS